MGRKVKIGIVQMKQDPSEGYEERLTNLEQAAIACFEEGAEIVFFPEAYQHVLDRDVIYRQTEMIQKYESWKARCSVLARKYHAYLVPWDYEPCQGRVYNSSYILDREGNEVGRYHKVNLTRGECEKGIIHGDDYPVFDLDFGRVGIMICFDNYFPESAAVLGNRGAELVLYPLYGDTLDPQWELKLRARACDHSMYIACCQIDNVTNVAFSGLVGPDGTILRKLSEYPEHCVVEADLSQPVYTNTMNKEGQREKIREYLKRCRQPGAYHGILEESPDILEWDQIFENR